MPSLAEVQCNLKYGKMQFILNRQLDILDHDKATQHDDPWNPDFVGGGTINPRNLLCPRRVIVPN